MHQVMLGQQWRTEERWEMPRGASERVLRRYRFPTEWVYFGLDHGQPLTVKSQFDALTLPTRWAALRFVVHLLEAGFVRAVRDVRVTPWPRLAHEDQDEIHAVGSWLRTLDSAQRRAEFVRVYHYSIDQSGHSVPAVSGSASMEN